MTRYGWERDHPTASRKIIERWPIPNGPLPSKKRLPDNLPFAWRGKIYRRIKGVLYAAHRGGFDPTLSRAFWKRTNRKAARENKRARRVLQLRGFP